MITYGLVNSVVLALIALGFSITFGISRVANFAYGGIYILSGVIGWFFLVKLGFPYPLAATVSVASAGLLGALIYRFLLQRLRGLELSEVISTFALGLIILETLRTMGVMGFDYRLPPFSRGSVEILGTYVSVQRLVIIASGAILLILLHLFVHNTKIGLAFRGVAQDDHTAFTVGINPDKISMLSLALGSMVCSVAALLILPLGTISVDAGYDILLKALAVCIVGGLESTTGIVLASFIIGYTEVFTAMYISSSLTIVVPLFCMLAILLVRPSGLFGKHKELEERI